MPEVHHDVRSSWDDMRDLTADRILVLLGGASGLALGVFAFLLAAVQGAFVGALGSITGVNGALLTLIIVLVFASLLLFAFTVMGRDRIEGSALAAAFSLVLVIFGSVGGIIAGVLGIMGAGLGIWRHRRATA